MNRGENKIYHRSEMHDELEQVYYALQDDGTGTVYGDTGWYLVVLGQYKAVLVGFCWYRLLLEDL